MAKKPDTPCAGGCGKLLWGGPTSLPAGLRKCRDCRREELASGSDQRCPHCGEVLPLVAFSPSAQRKAGSWCRACHRERHAAKAGRNVRPPVCGDCGGRTTRGANASGRLCEACAKERKRIRWSRKTSLRRAVERFTDITPEYERALRKRTRRCPICRAWMTCSPGKPNSKHLDHIIPLVIHGTHTVGNVRIICRSCNLSRPKDGSDLAGHQPTLWAQDLAAVEEFTVARAARAESRTCRCGRPLVSGSCRDCPVRLEERRLRAEAGRRAAQMRADGVKWREISEALELHDTGSAYHLAWQYGDRDVISKWPRGRGWMARAS